jgi:hypothetical protein
MVKRWEWQYDGMWHSGEEGTEIRATNDIDYVLAADYDVLETRNSVQAQGWHDACIERNALVDRVATLEAALRQQISVCRTCDGRGGWEADGENLPYCPCPTCKDARALLAPESPTGG